MRRRELFGVLGGAAAWPLAAWAQQPTKILRVGTVAGTPKSSPHWAAFQRRMGELGYQEGRNFSFDFLQAASADEYEVLYRKLAARVPDVILAIGPEIGLKSALAVTRALPIVMIAIDYDPLARGYLTSLARPTGNVTGVGPAELLSISVAIESRADLARKQSAHISRLSGIPAFRTAAACWLDFGMPRGGLP
jgi:putative ABC transport system substrate-binding protein